MTRIPEFSVGVPDSKLLFKSIVLSAILTISDVTVVVAPDTVKLPVTTTSPEIVPPADANFVLANVYEALA